MAVFKPDWTWIKAMCLKALANGGRWTNRTTVEWNLARRCQRPVLIERYARLDVEDHIPVWDTHHFNATEPRWEWRRSSDFRLNLDMLTECRKCAECLKAKGREWAARARSEIRASHRTWFGTITLSPEQHHLMRSRAMVRLHKRGVDFDELSEDEQWHEWEHECYRELLLMWKRARKGTKCLPSEKKRWDKTWELAFQAYKPPDLRKFGRPPLRFRFIAVCESSPDHQSGAPHYHVLVHEIADPIKHWQLAGRQANRKRDVFAKEPLWPHGWSQFELAETTGQSARYVSKYVSKDPRARVRASKSYGRTPRTVSTDKKPPSIFPSGKIEGVHSVSVNSIPSTKGGTTSRSAKAIGDLTQGRDEHGNGLSGARISDPVGTRETSSSDGLSKSDAASSAGKRQSATLDWRSRERQFADDEPPPF